MKPYEKILAVLSALVLIGVPLMYILLTGCAMGNREWRRESYGIVVESPGAGDEQCSPPAPWTLFPACKVHDLAYEYARHVRCEGGDPVEYSQQARLVADSGLLWSLAQDGYGDLIATPYYIAVRAFGWWPWRFEGCKDLPTGQ